MTEDFDLAFKLTIGNEGGFQNGKLDSGNWTGGFIGRGQLKGTKFGISAKSYPDLDIAELTLDQARAIYQRDYWEPVGGGALPRPVACEAFDAAVNHGVEAALDFIDLAAPHPDPQVWKARIIAARLRAYAGLKGWLTYGRGWAIRMATNLENGT